MLGKRYFSMFSCNDRIYPNDRLNKNEQSSTSFDCKRAVTLPLLMIFSAQGLALQNPVLLDTSAGNKAAIAQACDFEHIRFESNFDTGKLDGCEQIQDNTFVLTSKPENRPINPSPWYAFKVTAKAPLTSKLTIIIRSEKAKARYTPKMSRDKKDWQALPFTMMDNDLRISLSLQTISKHPEGIYIAGQEIIDNRFYDEWIDAIASNSDFTKTSLGLSTSGRRINALTQSSPDNKEWFLIIGRQHPPEVTGAIALINFVEELAKNSDLHADFFSRFNLMIIPNLNPDGLADGHWRHNTKGIDLNRDWGKFTQIETTLVETWLKQMQANEQRLVFALDFHSTQQDVFYTMPSDYSVAPQSFSENWLKSLKEATLSSFVVRPRPGTSPGRGVFKQYLADVFNIHSITYEMGDNTQRELIEHVAQVSAITLMQHMLSTAPDEFVFTVPETIDKP